MSFFFSYSNTSLLYNKFRLTQFIYLFFIAMAMHKKRKIKPSFHKTFSLLFLQIVKKASSPYQLLLQLPIGWGDGGWHHHHVLLLLIEIGKHAWCICGVEHATEFMSKGVEVTTSSEHE